MKLYGILRNVKAMRHLKTFDEDAPAIEAYLDAHKIAANNGNLETQQETIP